MNESVLKEIETIRTRLDKIEEVLKVQPITVETAEIGDYLKDGWIVGHKETRFAILLAPQKELIKGKWEAHYDAPIEKDWFFPSAKMMILLVNNLAGANRAHLFIGNEIHLWTIDSIDSYEATTIWYKSEIHISSTIKNSINLYWWPLKIVTF